MQLSEFYEISILSVHLSQVGYDANEHRHTLMHKWETKWKEYISYREV